MSMKIASLATAVSDLTLGISEVEPSSPTRCLAEAGAGAQGGTSLDREWGRAGTQGPRKDQ